jgi:hypothetical protein
VFNNSAARAANLGFSYQTCASPDCYNHPDGSACPVNWDGTCCDCVYQGGLPAGVFESSDYSDDPLVSSYGTQCAPWDSMEGTPWFAYCDLHEEKDWCSREDSWCNDPWCYVDKNRCNSWAQSDVFPDVENLGFSYEACHAMDCYTDKDKEGCPYEGNGQLHHCDECPDDHDDHDGHDHGPGDCAHDGHDHGGDSDDVSGASSLTFMGALLVAVMVFGQQ